MRKLLGLMGAVPLPPLPEFVAVGTTKTYTGVTDTGNVAMPAGVQDGDLLLAFLAVATTPTITPDAAWSLIKQQNLGPRRMWAYSRIAASEPANYVWSFGASVNGVAFIMAIRPAASSGAVEAFDGSDNASSTSAPSPSVTALGANRLLVCAWACPAAIGSITHDAAMDLRGTGQNGAWLKAATQAVQAGATGTRTATLSGAATSGGISILVKGA